MRLSEAIRLGATMKPQAFDFFFQAGGSCALGAASDAIGRHPDDINLKAVWPVIETLNRLPCPECVYKRRQWMITHLNDHHRWSRERIADLVEIYEMEADLAKGTDVHAATKEIPSEVQG